MGQDEENHLSPNKITLSEHQRREIKLFTLNVHLSYIICFQAPQLQGTFSAVIIKRPSTRNALKLRGTLSGYRSVDQLQVSLAGLDIF